MELVIELPQGSIAQEVTEETLWPAIEVLAPHVPRVAWWSVRRG